MTTTTDERPLKMVYCSGCSRPTGEFSRDYNTKVGRCCENLPAPWAPGGYREDPDDEEDTGVTPHCSDCGSALFDVVTTRHFSESARGYTPEETATLYIDEANAYETAVSIHCAECFEPYTGSWDWC